MEKFNIPGENRAAPRTPVNLHISCEQNGRVTPCEITDLSPQGIGIRINSLLVPGDKVNMIIGDHTLRAAVVRSNGNMVGLWFRDLTNDQLSYIKQICRKSGNGNETLPENEIVNSGKKIYVLKAETEKDKGLLGLFLASLKNNFKGLIDVAPLEKGAYQVEIYDNPSSVTSFESLLVFWKAGNLVLK